MDTELQIVISAVDEASAAFEEIEDSLAGVSDAAATMVDATTASFNEFTAAIAQAATDAGVSETEILQQMQATGLGAQEVADEIVAANEEIDASNDLTKGSFMPVGIAAGIAFAAVESAISSSVSSAQSWDEESAIIAQTLKDTGSAIPLSQVQDYAQHVQSVTLLTQQQALQSEGLILSYQNLQPQYESLTMLSADLATKMSQTSGDMADNLPNATKILVNALEDPVAGINQLIRQGTVAFPAATVTMIENMAKVGDTAGADAIILDTLNRKVGGMAEAAAQAPGAGLTQLSNSLTSLGTQVGNDLLPDLDLLAKALLPIITNITNWANEHPKLTEAILAGVLAFTAFLAAATLIGIVIAAAGASVALAMVVISAAVAGFIALVLPNWKTFWDGFQDVVNVATQITAAVIEGALDLILAAVYLFSNLMTGTFNVMADIIKVTIDTAFNLITGVVTDQMKAIETTWQLGWNVVSTIATDVWAVIGNTVKTGVNDVISVINGFINALDAIHITLPSITIPGTKLSTPAVNLGFTIPDIPMLAAGGFVTQPTLALIGEAGPEAVIPLSSGMGAGGAAGGQQIVINIQGGIFPTDTSTITKIGNLLAKSVVASLRTRNYAS
jgi:hypothetical protein